MEYASAAAAAFFFWDRFSRRFGLEDDEEKTELA
jgi:hypothetical protein